MSAIPPCPICKSIETVDQLRPNLFRCYGCWVTFEGDD